MHINFYQLQGTNQAAVDEALPQLLEKALGVGQVALVVANSVTAERLNERLWTADPESFLPHQLFSDTQELGQGVTLFSAEEFQAQLNKISSEIIVVINGSIADYNTLKATKLLDIFTSDEGNTQSARQRWKAHVDFEKAYFAQSDRGWQKKA